MKRKFILGDEWLYYKVYCGPSSADLILQDVILPLTRNLQNDNQIKLWFFIRYQDPEPHIRLRLKLTKLAHLGDAVAMFKHYISPFLISNLVWSVQIDTYVRELERYGSSTIEPAEQIFFCDSDLVANTIPLIEDEEFYFLFVLKCIDSFLNQFQLKEDEKWKFYEQNALAFKHEFNVGKLTLKSLSKKYNVLKDRLERILFHNLLKDYGPLQELLNKRNKAIDHSAKKIISLRNENKLEVNFSDLLGSYVHMFFNRAFRDRQRFYEMVGYDSLQMCTRRNYKQN